MKLSKEKQKELLAHYGKDEGVGEWDNTVVAQDKDGENVTIGEIRKANGHELNVHAKNQKKAAKEATE